ncbi:diguanylate cyclase [Mycobacterium sp. PSTR-4-N]|uniref:GGDEF domain-containing protein n=1 Tax=Mycobacterium sp. PSTR-4-N TaxID=2917745 RepID=UPI001F155A9A|nr:diguanylate cyclase [Mycobacterium sp. PSTR-4-N]MCG7594415.1 sensor domain-containing diguanylate cyclase [Mycobacterium sp. PSTR-4-N]
MSADRGVERVRGDMYGGTADEPSLPDAASDLQVLRALLRIAEAVARADAFDEALEVIAEQALAAVRASSLSISRWEADLASLRTIINVGDLAPGETRWPTDEYYPMGGDPHVAELLLHGRPYLNALDEPDCPPHCVAWLEQIGKESEIAVPIMSGDSMWGEIWASGDDGRRFDLGDAQLLSAIAAYITVALNRSETLNTVWGYAMQDPLTGIANRRAVDQRFAELDWETSTPVVMLCDLDGFKRINDRDGHPAGDQLLRDVAAVLGSQADTVEGAIAARLGGDEFCIVLPDATLASAQVFATDATRALHDVVDREVSLCWGAATTGPNVRSAAELLAAADAALLHAKRQGPARYSTGASPSPDARDLTTWDRRSGPRRAVDRLASDVVRMLDEQPDMTLASALEALAVALAQALDAAAWAISETAGGGTMLRLVSNVASVRKREAGLTVLVDFGPPNYALADYPASARAIADGSTFLAAVGMESADPDEIALLRELGYRAVLGIGVPAGDTGYLLEIYSHDGYTDLAEIAPLARVLAAYCVTRVSGNQPSRRRPSGSDR